MLGSFFWVTFARPSFPWKLGTLVQLFLFEFLSELFPLSALRTLVAVQYIVERWISKTRILATEDFEAGLHQALAMY